MSAFVSKSRRPKFDLTLRIIDLNNVPLVSGNSFVKWHIPSSNAAEHRGRTQKAPIRDHRVQYDDEKRIPVRITVGKDGMLQECQMVLEVLQEYSGSGRGERITLGNVKLNLAEYVEASELQSPVANSPGGGAAPPEGVVRRYLMQDSKINSTLKLGIHMRHIEGTRDYYAPPLKTAPVFGGIAGIISSAEPTSTTHGVASVSNADQATTDAVDVPSLSANSREVGEMQDTYRRTLAAYWSSQPGELKADECIEDIFAGGDGWGKNGAPQPISRPGSSTSTPVPDDEESKRNRDGTQERGGLGFGGRGFGGYNNKKRVVKRAPGELDEFDVREDLRSWTIGERAYA